MAHPLITLSMVCSVLSIYLSIYLYIVLFSVRTSTTNISESSCGRTSAERTFPSRGSQIENEKNNYDWNDISYSMNGEKGFSSNQNAGVKRRATENVEHITNAKGISI